MNAYLIQEAGDYVVVAESIFLAARVAEERAVDEYVEQGMTETAAKELFRGNLHGIMELGEVRGMQVSHRGEPER